MRGFAARFFAPLFSLELLFLAAACGGGGGEENPFGLQSELVTQAAQADALAFAPDGRLFYVEHWNGAIRVIGADGELQEEPFATIPNSASALSWGLTGLALDPEFEVNPYVYAYYTEVIDPGPPLRGRPTVIRFTDAGGKGTDPTVITSDLPEANAQSPFNANGSLHFGPDGLLYLTIGDNDMSTQVGPGGKPLPQDLATAIGKMLRIRKDGTVPTDNPFADGSAGDPRIFALGFRNNFNFTFDPHTGALYGTDSTGPTCEGLRIIEKGGNYGWPEAGEWPYADCQAANTKGAIYYFSREGFRPGDFTSTVGVTGMEFVSGAVYPSLGESLLVCEGPNRLMRRLVLSGPNFDQLSEDSQGSDGVVTEDCFLDIAVSPDGIVYYSNLTEIRRLVPPTATEPAG